MKDKDEPDRLTKKMDPLEDEEIIELTDEMKVAPKEDEEAVEIVDLHTDQDMETVFVSSQKMDLESEIDILADLPDVEKPDFTLSPEQVEEALERVVKKMYSEKIENMLTEVIEKAVTKEMERLKAVLLEGTASEERL